MLFEVEKGSVLCITDSQWAAMQQRDIVLHKGAVVITVPDGATAVERTDIILRVMEGKRGAG